MPNSHPWRHYGSSIALLSCFLFSTTAHSATAEISTGDDYLAVSVEAEDFEQSDIDTEHDDDRWVLTDPTTPQTSDDPDENNSDGAVGEMYLEVLPDIRVRASDPFGPPLGFWGSPGAGPTLKYNVDFPEAGRYYLHVRVNSSGYEDNGVHAGLNEDWPDSSARVQTCSARDGWVWTSRQRGDGDEVPHCGVNYTLWLDIPEAGVNTVKFSAREDGFEFDRFALIKDKSNNTRRCRPDNETEFVCSNGALEETTDGFTDVDIRLEVDRTAGVEEDLFVFNALISNEDEFDVANQVIMESTLDLIDTWEFVSASDVCTLSGQTIQCMVGDLEPTAPDEDLNIQFTLRAFLQGEHTVGVDITTTSVDENAANDTASIDVSVEQLITYATIESRISRDIAKPNVTDTIELTVALENTSSNDSDNTTVTLTPPADLRFGDSDTRCTNDATDQLVCNIGLLEANSSQAVSINLHVDIPEFYAITVDIGTDNLEEGSFSSTYLFEVIDVEESVEEIDPESETKQNVTDTTADVENRDTTEEGDSTVSEEVGVVAQSSGGGAIQWALLIVMSCVTWMRRSKLSMFSL